MAISQTIDQAEARAAALATTAPPREERMEAEAVGLVIQAFKDEGIDLVVTLPEEPTYSLTDAIRKDPYFTAVTVAAEGNGLALCAGASLGGRSCVFVTGVAGMLVGTWAMAQTGMIFGAPFLIVASYRGDFGDKTGIPGSQLRMFKKVAEPLVKLLDFPYRVVDKKESLPAVIRDAHFVCRSYETPVVLLLTGEVLK